MDAQDPGNNRLTCEVKWDSFGTFHKLTRMHPQKSLLRNRELNVGPYDSGSSPYHFLRATLRVRGVYVDLITHVGSVRVHRGPPVARLIGLEITLLCHAAGCQTDGRMEIKGWFSVQKSFPKQSLRTSCTLHRVSLLHIVQFDSFFTMGSHV